MCARGTPAGERLACNCSKVIGGGTLVIALLIVAFVLTHLLLIVVCAGVLVAGTVGTVIWMQRFVSPSGVRAYQRAAQAPSRPAVTAREPEAVRVIPRARPASPLAIEPPPAMTWRVTGIEKVPAGELAKVASDV